MLTEIIEPSSTLSFVPPAETIEPNGQRGAPRAQRRAGAWPRHPGEQDQLGDHRLHGGLSRARRGRSLHVHLEGFLLLPGALGSSPSTWASAWAIIACSRIADTGRPSGWSTFFPFAARWRSKGGPIFWVATHRVHHQLTDREGDPHTPHDGGWWSHAGWILSGDALHHETALMARYAPDLAKDRFQVWLSKYHYVPMIVVGLALLAFGGWSCVMWGIFLRVTLGLHATWLVNSATHMWGSRRFSTRDESRNNWWVALLTGGEGWHNNHHAHPVSVRHGLTWWEFDPELLWHLAAEEVGPRHQCESSPVRPSRSTPRGRFLGYSRLPTRARLRSRPSLLAPLYFG